MFERIQRYSLYSHPAYSRGALSTPSSPPLRSAFLFHAGWWRPLGIFELAKLKTVEMTLERFVEHRRAGNLPANFGHIGLPFNILEAVMQARPQPPRRLTPLARPSP